MIRRALLFIASATLMTAQTPRPSDWLSSGGDARRSGVEANDSQVTRSSVKDFKVVLQRRLGNGELLNPPIVIGRLISHRGFRELAIVTSVQGQVWAIDVDLDLVFWERQLPAGTSPTCGLTPMPAMMPAPETGPARNLLRPVLIAAADGKLYRLNPSTGEDSAPPLPFLPPNSNPADLTVDHNVVRTGTTGECGAPKATWSIDVMSGHIEQTAYSADLFAPVTRVSANGVVFSLSGNALHANDATTGAELFSSGTQLTSAPTGTGLSIANGRVYFTTVDGTLWAFGIPLER